VLGHLLQPDDLVRVPAGSERQVGGRGQRLGCVAGVDAEHVDARGAQEPAGHLVDAELRPPVEVVLRGRARGQVEQRRAPLPDGEPDLGVEQAGAEGAHRRRLGEETLEPGAVEVPADHAVAVVVDEPRGLHVRQQFGHRALLLASTLDLAA
jgi:hypothetical protein